MNILILGVDGMIGHQLWRYMSQRDMDVHGLMRRPIEDFDASGVFDSRVFGGIDATSFPRLEAVLDAARPEVLINCIGITKRKAEATDPGMMLEVNAWFPHRLAHWAAQRGVRLIHFSTDCVFDGSRGQYSESDIGTATDLYGITKYLGEVSYPHCLTLRSSMIGRELSGKTELLEWFLAQDGKVVGGFTNAFFSGVTTNYMASLVWRIANEHRCLSGLYNVAGPRIAKFDLLVLLREAFSVDVEIVPDPSFSCDRSLDAASFRGALRMEVPGWPELIAELAADRAPYDR